jgi:hypothetical protein
MLFHATVGIRHLDPNAIEDGRHNIGNMVVLVAHLAASKFS